MVINGSNADREKFLVGKVTVKHATLYIYLGSPFTEECNISSVIDMHLKSRISQINKFKLFCNKMQQRPLNIRQGYYKR